MNTVALKVAQAYLKDVEAFDFKSIITKFKKIRGPKLIDQIVGLLSKLQIKPTPEEISQATAEAVRLVGSKEASTVEAFNARLSLLTAIASLMLLAGIPKDTLAKNLDSITKNPTTVTQVIKKEAPKFSIITNTFTLMGTTRTDTRVVDNATGEVLEAKGFTNDQKGADGYLKSVQQKYSDSQTIKE